MESENKPETFLLHSSNGGCFYRLPSLRYFGNRNSHSLQSGKGINAEKISFLFGVHPIQLDAIPVSFESEPLKNIFFCAMFKILIKKLFLALYLF